MYPRVSYQKFSCLFGYSLPVSNPNALGLEYNFFVSILNALKTERNELNTTIVRHQRSGYVE